SLLPLTSTDAAIAEKANDLAAVIVSKDADFVDLHERGVLKVPLVRVRLGNVTSALICTTFRQRIPAICAALEAGERLAEIREQTPAPPQPPRRAAGFLRPAVGAGVGQGAGPAAPGTAGGARDQARRRRGW